MLGLEPLNPEYAPMLTPFHLAYHVTDLNEARAFYGNVLGCREGRSTETWVDFDFFGKARARADAPSRAVLDDEYRESGRPHGPDAASGAGSDAAGLAAAG